MTIEQHERQFRYLLGVAVGRGFLFRALIDERDYARLEDAFAEKFAPLVRHLKPCLSERPLITLSKRRKRK